MHAQFMIRFSPLWFEDVGYHIDLWKFMDSKMPPHHARSGFFWGWCHFPFLSHHSRWCLYFRSVSKGSIFNNSIVLQTVLVDGIGPHHPHILNLWAFGMWQSKCALNWSLLTSLCSWYWPYAQALNAVVEGTITFLWLNRNLGGTGKI